MFVCRLFAVGLIWLGCQSALVAAVTYLDVYRLGENDPGAVSGNVGNATTVDAVGGNHLSRVGSPVYTNNTIAYDSSLAMTFSGVNGVSDERYAIGAPISTLVDNFGIELLARVNADGFSDPYSAVAYNGNSGPNGWGIYRENNSYIGLFGGAAVIGTGVIPAVPGTYQHLALVRDSGTTTLYVEGIPAVTFGGAPNMPTTGFGIGGNHNGGENFRGSIDNVRVFTFAPGTFNAATDLKPGYVNLAGYRMGEMDPGAANGNATNATTVGLFGPTLTKSGATPTYSNATAGGGTSLGINFTGTLGEQYSAPVFSNITDNFRLEAWASSNSVTDNAVVVYNGDTGGGGGYGIFRFGNQWAVLYGGVVLQGFAPVQTGVLTHLALERRDEITRFFVDGVLAGTLGNAPNTPNGFFMIGGNAISGIENFDGVIDEVRFLQLVPEPSGIVLAGVALMGLFSMRRRNR